MSDIKTPPINKFSFAQLTSNNDGKTSGSGSMGVLICTVGSLCFLLGVVDKMFLTKTIDIVNESIILIGIGAALLGYRKSRDSGFSNFNAPADPSAPADPVEPTDPVDTVNPCTCPPDCKCGNCDKCK